MLQGTADQVERFGERGSGSISSLRGERPLDRSALHLGLLEREHSESDADVGEVARGLGKVIERVCCHP